jgi:hypothetical protein
MNVKRRKISVYMLALFFVTSAATIEEWEQFGNYNL